MFGCRCCEVSASPEVVVTGGSEKPSGSDQGYTQLREDYGPGPEEASQSDVLESSSKTALAAKGLEPGASEVTLPPSESGDTFLVQIKKEEGQTVGMDLIFHKRSPVEVQSIKKGSLIDQWNEKNNTGNQVLAGSLILKLNGEPFRPKTIKEVAGLFAKPVELNLVFQRPPGAS
mmetsp:Transcript_69289/g.129401  ORF Transcript_69289/g.129401 Transcript_69289/m.129401 type:complete len:174 (-) Transcript_69289:12-533(-)